MTTGMIVAPVLIARMAGPFLYSDKRPSGLLFLRALVDKAGGFIPFNGDDHASFVSFHSLYCSVYRSFSLEVVLTYHHF